MPSTRSRISIFLSAATDRRVARKSGRHALKFGALKLAESMVCKAVIRTGSGAAVSLIVFSTPWSFSVSSQKSPPILESAWIRWLTLREIFTVLGEAFAEAVGERFAAAGFLAGAFLVFLALMDLVSSYPSAHANGTSS